jgi:hypothetical protein
MCYNINREREEYREAISEIIFDIQIETSKRGS